MDIEVQTSGGIGKPLVKARVDQEGLFYRATL